MKKYFVMHSHFYQPPRENPWIQEIELQESASPFHDWNERIFRECYLPNAYSRIMGPEARILEIVNNYEYMSFNFGPTLMSWIRKKKPEIYKRIIEADWKSASRLHHGNAIAQVYNHIIMPLAKKSEKQVQVEWALYDFREHFGREPESLWLSETAVNYETVEVLADFGIKYIILSPHQVERCRKIEAEKWTDCASGNIDITRPYRIFCRKKDGSFDNTRYVDAFFYNGGIARGIAFEGLLNSSRALADRIEASFGKEEEAGSDSNRIVSVATDGETFGHHYKFGELTVSHLLKYELPSRDIVVTNYAAYLEKNPPEYQADLKGGKEDGGTAWSCIHGVGRWDQDCGCNTGGLQNWNQKWRRPLRAALDRLKDNIDDIYKKEGEKYFTDPVLAKKLSIMLNSETPEKYSEFAAAVVKGKKDGAVTIPPSALKLLEMTKYASYSFTSCAWFFSELSGIEVQQNLKYAAYAIQLAREVSGIDLEPVFLTDLSLAKSNIKEYGTGADIYRRYVPGSVFDENITLAQYAFDNLVSISGPKTYNGYSVKDIKIAMNDFLSGSVFGGRVVIENSRLGEKFDKLFFAAAIERTLFICVLKDFSSESEQEEVLKCVNTADAGIIIRGIDNYIPEFLKGKIYRLKDILVDERYRVLSKVYEQRRKNIVEDLRRIYERNKYLLENYEDLGWKIPVELEFSARIAVVSGIMETLKNAAFADMKVYEKVNDMLEFAKKNGIKYNSGEILDYCEHMLKSRFGSISEDADKALALKPDILNIIDIIKETGDGVSLYLSVNAFYETVGEKVFARIRAKNTGYSEKEVVTITACLEIAEKLGFAVSNFLTEFRRLKPEKT